MGDQSKIEWTDATWNPIVGCGIVSPGCTNCYAMRQAQRIELMSDGSHSKGAGWRIEGSSHYAGTTKEVNGNPVWTGKLALAPDHILTMPLRWKKTRMIFVNSMGDLFHEDCPDQWIDQVFAIMALAPHHVFQVLTKRSLRMRDYLTRLEIEHNRVLGVMAGGMAANFRDMYPAIDAFPHYSSSLAHPSQHGLWPLPNVWLGVSTEDQKRAEERIPHLLDTPASIRFVSAEPLLGPVKLYKLRYGPGWMDAISGYTQGGSGYGSIERRHLDWVIAGGESGPKARPMHPDWVRSLRDQCTAAAVPFFFKQWGEFGYANHPGSKRPKSTPDRIILGDDRFSSMDCYRIGKKRAGRRLDGREHNGIPEVQR